MGLRNRGRCVMAEINGAPARLTAGELYEEPQELW